MALNESVELKSSFAPVAGSGTRVLILGSLPGEASLARSQYYAHPQNQFWRLVGAVVGADLQALDYQPRLDALRAGGVGLWDVVRSAKRVGSLDGAIRDHQPNALAEFAATLPALSAIAFNGGKASAIGRRQLGLAPPWALISLPSSSPAHTMAFGRKEAEWLILKRYLGSSPTR
jgi:double-stranded uracil-DNA glycosylase